MRWPPLVPLLIAAVAGIVADRTWDGCTTRSWIDLAFVAAASGLLGLRRPRISSAAMLAAALCLAAGWHHARWSDRAADDIGRLADDTPRPAWLRGVITDVLGRHRTEGYGAGEPDREVTRMFLAVTQVCDGRRWHAASGNVAMVAAGDRTDIQAGQPVEAAGTLSRVAGPLNPGEFDYRAYLRSRGVDAHLFVDGPGGLSRDPTSAPWPWTARLARARDACRAELESHLDGPTAALASALILGRREDIDPADVDAFSLTGTTHLLAISGLQLQALALFLAWLLRLASVPRISAYAAIAIGTVGYAALVGLAPSVVRSAAMTLAFCVAGIARRPSRPANTLALAGLLCLAWSPFYAFDVGCQLSFLAIAALIWLVPRAREGAAWLRDRLADRFRRRPAEIVALEREFEPRWRRWPRRAARGIVQGMILSAVVWLAAVPLVALRFHLVSPIGILLNIPLIPITTAALLLGASGLGIGLTGIPGLGVLLIRLAEWLLRLTEIIVRWGASQPWGHRFAAGPAAWAVAVFYLLLMLASIAFAAPVLLPGPMRGRQAALLAAAAAVLIPGWLLVGLRIDPPPIEGDVLAVGHGLAVTARLADGTTLLYDCGRMGDPRVGRRIIAPALWSRGITRIDQVFLSHADLDHYNGLPDLLDRFAVGEVVVPPGFGGEANPAASSLLDELRDRRVPVRVITAGESWRRSGVTFAVLHPPAGFPPETSDNARSLVLDIEHGGRRIMLTGDLDAEGTAALLQGHRPEPSPDLFLSPHHGGRTANPTRLYDWARPKAVVVSQRTPQFGTKDALEGLDGRAMPVLRTWQRGAVAFRPTRDGLTLAGYLDAPATAEAATMAGGAAVLLGVFPPAAWPIAGITGLAIGLLGLLIGLAACVLMAIVEYGAWTLVVPPRPRVGDDEEGPRPRVGRRISIQAADGTRLSGRWHPASDRPPSGRTAVLIHGFAEASSQIQAARVAALNAGGWDVAAIDLRGYGESDGAYASFGGREAGDVSRWLDELARLVASENPQGSFVPVLWGRSMGAAVAIRAAAEDCRIRALVLESPMVDLDDAMRVWFRSRRFPASRFLARLVTRRAGRIAGVSLTRPQPIELAPRVECPALGIHGEADRLVPSAAVRSLLSALRAGDRLIEVPGAGHTDVIAVGGEPLLGQVVAFLDAASAVGPGQATG
ncbi:ComEC/Rec2 family competence protein [Aquisphaera giovannonii]|uniref:ComEC/Rec2 family competence protein n=1 Tax=Aquisphaera giovannonii TaxID=406548 RepID=UPI00143D1A03|nr:ComEC/Rec2 family competence protein [Aquisphaera giovannonii]